MGPWLPFPPPIASVSLDAGLTLTVRVQVARAPSRSEQRECYSTTLGRLFGDTTPGIFTTPATTTVTGAGGKDVGAFTGSMDVPTTPFVWTNIPSVTVPLDRSKDLTINWTGGLPNTQVTAVGGSGTSAFCAQRRSALGS